MRLDGIIPPLIVFSVAIVLVAWRQLTGGKKAVQKDVAIVCLIAAVAGFLEWRMGRPLKYRNGPVRVWSGNVASDQNSQQIADPYTLTHFEHGAVFYGLTKLAMRSASPGLRAIVVVALEAAWESYENTDTVVERYRKATISLGYYGDSVINSIADIVACMIGFVLAWKLPRSATVAWVIAFEIILALWIRDNLALNILMLIRPFDVVRRWQMHL
jgi:hypothetical protein